MFEDVPNTPAGGERLERRVFLDGALHVERRRGLVFGAFKNRWNGFGLNDPDVKFHGLTVSANLPRVSPHRDAYLPAELPQVPVRNRSDSASLNFHGAELG